MTIRSKLLLSYILMIIIPIALFFLFIHLLFHLFVDRLIEVKDYYHIEQSFLEEFVHEDMMLLAELQHLARHDPEQLTVPYMAQYEDQLAHRQAGLVVRRNKEIIYQSDLIDQPLIEQLPVHSLGGGDHYAYEQGYIETDGHDWLFTSSYFYFADQSEGSLFIAIDGRPVSSFIRVVIPTLVIIFLVVFVLTNGLLKLLVSRHIIVPLRKLQGAVNNIREGNLDDELSIERKDEFGELSDSFEQMRLKLRESVETQLKYEDNRRELINNISHDLKTPITSIKGYVEGIMDGVANDPEKLDKYVRTIYNKATQMDQMIDELLLFSKLDLNRLPFQFEKVSLQRYIYIFIEAMSIDLEKMNIQLMIESDLSDQVMVVIDQDKLHRALSNIIYNSMKFMDKEEKSIDIRISKDETFAFIAIEDNGMGIEAAELAHVFDRFYRAEASRNSDRGGSGIGLAIAKHIIEAHGGTIEIQSEFGKGTIVSFSLKLAEDLSAKGNKNGEDSYY